MDEGTVGAGTGTGALGFKAGIGTSSRVVAGRSAEITIAALVQANFSGTLPNGWATPASSSSPPTRH